MLDDLDDDLALLPVGRPVSEAEIFGALEPTYDNPYDRMEFGQTEPEFFGREVIGALVPTFDDGSFVHIGGILDPTTPDIMTFVSGDQKTVKKSTSHLNLNSNMSTATFRNTIPGSKLTLNIVQTWTKYKKKALGGRGDQVDDGQKTGMVVLEYQKTPTIPKNIRPLVKVTGYGITVTNKEGWVDEAGWFRDRYYDRNTSVTIEAYDPPAVAGKPPPETIHPGGGGGTEDDTSALADMPSWAPWAVGAVVVVGVVGGAVWYLRGR